MFQEGDRRSDSDMGCTVTMIIFSVALLTGTIVGATPGPYEIDIQTDFLNTLLSGAKLHSAVNGELNFSPIDKLFSNVVRTITGEKGKLC